MFFVGFRLIQLLPVLCIDVGLLCSFDMMVVVVSCRCCSFRCVVTFAVSLFLLLVLGLLPPFTDLF